MVYNSNWFQSVEKTPLPKAPAFSKTLQIDRVIAGSPAADLKLRPGDKLLSVNGAAAIIADIPSLLASSSSVTYRFFLPRESAFLEVATRGLPLGIITSISSDAIFEQYKGKGDFENEGLLTLWERGDYGHIRQACAIANKRLNIGNLLGKMVGKKKTFPLANMMTAICDIETGEAETGYAALGDYAVHHAAGQTSDVNAIIRYYNAMEMKSEKRRDAYQRGIEEAYSSYPESERIRSEAVRAGVEIDKPDMRIGRVINATSAWQYLEGGQGTTTLANILSGLAPGQILPLCLMAGYRGNGPYNDALLPYIAVQPYLSERMHPMVVLTSVAEKRKDRPYWNSHEDLAKKAGCPLVVLHGGMEDVVGEFSLRGAPEFFALDRNAKIIWTGDLGTDYGYWDMLDQTA